MWREIFFMWFTNTTGSKADPQHHTSNTLPYSYFSFKSIKSTSRMSLCPNGAECFSRTSGSSMWGVLVAFEGVSFGSWVFFMDKGRKGNI